MTLWGLEIGSWADLFAAVGTIGAVIMALKNRTDKANIVISASYVDYIEYEHDIIGKKESAFGGIEPIWGDKTNENLSDAGTTFRLYFINTRQSSSLITSWGLVDTNGEKIEISMEPIFVKGFDVVQIKRRTALEPGADYDYVIDKIDNITKGREKFKVYFEDVRGKVKYCLVKKQTRSNESC